MNCEICGKPIYGKPILIEVDGAYLKVCSSCAKFGKVVQERKVSNRKAMNVVTKPVEKRSDSVEDYELIENYGKVIKEIREKLNMTQEELGRKIGIKPSLLAKIEQEAIIPDIQTLTKLELSLKVKLRK